MEEWPRFLICLGSGDSWMLAGGFFITIYISYFLFFSCFFVFLFFGMLLEWWGRYILLIAAWGYPVVMDIMSGEMDLLRS